MPNVICLTPTTGICRMEYAQSLAQMVAYFASVRVFEHEPNQALWTDAVAGSGIAQNYERMVVRNLERTDPKWTHFLSVEDDMGFPPDALHRLLRHNLPIVGANYSTNKGKKQRFTAAGFGKQCVTREGSTGVEEVSLLPQGLTLVAREVYETLPRPWFLMGHNPDTGEYVYQDYYFSELAKHHGFKLYVDHDLSKQMIHVGPKQYTYQDVEEG